MPALLEMMFSLYCSAVCGVSTEYTSGMSRSSASIRLNSARLSPRERISPTLASSVAVNSRISVSPPKRSWNSWLSMAVCESLLR